MKYTQVFKIESNQNLSSSELLGCLEDTLGQDQELTIIELMQCASCQQLLEDEDLSNTTCLLCGEEAD